MNRWIEPEPCQPDSDLLAACHQDTLLAQILLRRGFRDPQRVRTFLSPDTYLPAPPEQLPDLVMASALLQAALSGGKRILVWGDFDVDGQTATAVLVEGLQRLGADVVYHIPNRTTESHGITLDSLRQQLFQHAPAVLLTCDTGTTEYEAIDHAKSAGLTVIVTDHHDLGARLPNADALINPLRLPPDHPLAGLPGVGVAYKLMQHIYTALGRERELPRLLDLVALGIIGDVATQTADTRYLLQIGLERLRSTERIGLLALMEAANVSPSALNADQIGYQISPRLNAAGRLGDAGISVELLLIHNWSRARILAQQLEGYNSERRAQTSRVENAIDKLLGENPSFLDSNALVLYDPKWHPGVLGIVAARLSERYRRPVVLFTGQDVARGSARSPVGYDIGKLIAAQADILRNFGGHPGAAGLSLDIGNIDVFSKRLHSDIAALRPESSETPPLSIDATVTFDELTLDLAQRIHRLAPFGEGNPPVTLATMNVRLSRAALLGREQKHRRLVVEDAAGRPQTFVWWQGAKEVLPDGRFDIAYTVTINEKQELQLAVVDIREYEGSGLKAQAIPRHVEDLRGEVNPLARLDAILAEAPDSLVWAEAYSRQQHPTWKRRADLVPADSLIIYTAPPDPLTLRDVLERFQPQRVYVLGLPPPLTTMDAVLSQLATAARNVIEHLDGKAHIDILTGATAQSPQVVRAGLDVLAAEGKIGVTWRNKRAVQISADPVAVSLDKATALARLEAAYHEVEAYRRYFSTAPLDQLLMP